ncbi:TlpA family protein disulfide reductase, partial [Bacteroidales bacterium OttesenSCG-928-B11]|nr:TlpA family protein disulfide reductase [Bacteroidales bacterium OttesenSCG-928-B11]
MKKLAHILFIATCIAQQCYAQTQIISLQKQETTTMVISTYLREEKDISQFKIPNGAQNFVIGYINISPYHSLYNNRLLSEDKLARYQSIVDEYDIDTLQFTSNRLKETMLHVLLYMQNDTKYCILDTDFDNSFVDEEVFKYNKNDSASANTLFLTNLKAPIDSSVHSTTKLIPIAVKMNSAYSVMGNNIIADSLQVDIFPIFFYQGYFIDNVDTFLIDLYMQHFDQLYIKQDVMGSCHCKTIGYFKHFELGTPIQIRKHKYLFEDFDIYNKTLTLKRLEDDTIGTNKGNYFAKMPGLDTLNGYTLVFFTGSWCKPCKILLDSLLVFHKQYPEITIISVNLERDSAKYFKYLDTYSIPWKVVLDNIPSPWAYTKVYSVDFVPTLFLINPQRKILWVDTDANPGIELLRRISEEGIESLESE